MANQPQTENISISQHIVYICSRFIAYSLPLFFFLVVNSFYLKTYDSAQIKITFTQMGATILALAWVIKICIQGKLPFSRRDMVYVAPFLAFLASGIVVWIHTPFKAWSLEETLRRVFYMIIAIITIAEIRTDERMKRLSRWLIATAWVALGYGLVQFIDFRFMPPPMPGIDPFIWRGAFSYRVFSTFGNPNFYGNYLVIMTPIILAAVLKHKGSLLRPFIVIIVTLFLALVIDAVTRDLFGKIDPSLSIVFDALMIGLLGLFVYVCTWRVGTSSSLPWYLILFSLLFLNIYSTETKGAWIGYVAAIATTIWLIFEYLLHFDERIVEAKRYFGLVVGLSIGLGLTNLLLIIAFVVPMVRGTTDQVGFQILWIPTMLFAIASVATVLWLLKRPWNMKKLIYGFLIFFVVAMGGGILQFAKKRLVSVSFRMFTWISTWEMIRTSPVLGNGVGTFKIIYPAFRRPEIIILEGRSNTETDHAEDEYLEVWQDEGFVGFGIFIWMILTAVFLGFKQLRYSSTHRAQDSPKTRKALDIEIDSRAYDVLGYLGALIGALVHWCFDVSIRFVSSGVFSGLLPGVLVAYARNHDKFIVHETRLSYDRWIRAGIAALWTAILLWLGVELVPQSLIVGGDTTVGQIWFWNIAVGVALFLSMEILEIGIASEKSGKFSEQYDEVNPRWFAPRLISIPFLVAAGLWAINFSAGQFWGDVHHNLAIFFSKEGIWNKSPLYDARIMNLPPDIREKYQNTGGALEHYKEVVTLNHAFPMAYYFTGNVYNDWGSQVNNESMNARNKGDKEEALRLKEKALDMWNKSEEAYNETKRLAPNYVQTHHQMGLLYVKRAEQAAQWGEMALSRELYEKAFEHFHRYRMLDPIFVPNIDRMVQIMLMQGKVNESIDLYKETYRLNDEIGHAIHEKVAFPDRLTAIATSIAKLYFNQTVHVPNPYNPPSTQVKEAIKYFQLAVDNDPKNLEAWKGLGFLLEKTGRSVEAQQAYHKALELSPNDPDLKRK